ncbi:YHS domain-containing protein [Palaeococcus ferrophilus]|uniref:YHS domain-containing protein n=1 Tax=Palaeococcus ferrophilus TaxID=83868 RepID=UPI00064E4807|nr:YHS domain-containing protein [Palaeococcus ferrophilus]
MPIDPVCGMEVDEGTGFRVEYKGRVYYFCSPGCKAEFEANPEKYVSVGHSHHRMHHMGGCHH